MDINRCRWVYMGVLGCRDTKLQQKEGMRDKIGQTGSDCDRMAGEISQNRHVCVWTGKRGRRDCPSAVSK